jgi:hypothetical protein
MRPWTVVFTQRDWSRLLEHHLRNDGEEHGSVLACGVVETPRENRLLVREVLPAADGTDYIQAHRKYTLVARFVAEKVHHCADERLAYIAVHNHGGSDAVAFSPTDLASHERGYPALLDITRDGPVGALVIAEGAAAGDIWTPSGRAPVEKVVVVGPRRQVIFPERPSGSSFWTAFDDRQARIFGADGQALIGQAKVVVVGAGGAGSLLSQALAHLGVGELVVIDDEVVEVENLRRVVGSVPTDARIEPWPGTAKVDVARRVATAVNPFLRMRPVHGNIVDPNVASMLRDADAAFLAADTMQARHVFNALSHQYLVPGFQVGARVNAPSGRVEAAFAVSRMVRPDATCMWCSNLISPSRLQDEALSPELRKAIRYVADVPAPSVITMNAMSTALALNDFLFSFTGLHGIDEMGPRRYDFLRREPAMEALPERVCEECAGRKARGDRAHLPTRFSS